MEGFVLAGGASLRMGRDKSLEVVGGLTLLERAVATLQQAGLTVRAVRAAGGEGEPAGCPVVIDAVADAGPLGGLFTALTVSSSDASAILACDLPLATPGLFRSLRDLLGDFDAAAPLDSSGQIHPLCAVYKKSCLPAVARRVTGRRLKTISLLTSGEIRCRLVPPRLHRLPDWRFLNVNSPSDLERLSRLSPDWDSSA